MYPSQPIQGIELFLLFCSQPERDSGLGCLLPAARLQRRGRHPAPGADRPAV